MGVTLDEADDTRMVTVWSVTGQPTGRGQFPSFVARSRANPARQLRDWEAWRDS